MTHEEQTADAPPTADEPAEGGEAGRDSLFGPASNAHPRFDEMLRLAKVAERVARVQHSILEKTHEQLMMIQKFKSRQNRAAREHALQDLTRILGTYLKDAGPPTNVDWSSVEAELRGPANNTDNISHLDDGHGTSKSELRG